MKSRRNTIQLVNETSGQEDVCQVGEDDVLLASAEGRSVEFVASEEDVWYNNILKCMT